MVAERKMSRLELHSHLSWLAAQRMLAERQLRQLEEELSTGAVAPPAGSPASGLIFEIVATKETEMHVVTSELRAALCEVRARVYDHAAFLARQSECERLVGEFQEWAKLAREGGFV